MLLITLFICLFLLLVVSAYTDLANGKVHNWCTYPAVVAGLALNFLIGGLGGDPSGDAVTGNYNLVNSAAGLLLGAFVLGVPSLAGEGVMGKGDVKLAAAIGALIGWYYLFWALFYSTLVGGIMAFSYAIWTGRLWDTLKGSFQFALTLRAPRAREGREHLKIPFGFAMVIGTYWCWFMFLDEPTFFPLLAGMS